VRVWKTLLDIRCGIDSGIPLCCIAWFIGPWEWLLQVTPHRAYFYHEEPSPGLEGLRVRYFRALGARGFDHIGCPLCLLRGRPVVVRETPFPDDLLTRLLIRLDSV
jgi:hypothetical protein